jgi:ribonuclease VapC
MLDAESLLMSSVAVLETRIVIFGRRGPEAVDLFEELLEKAGIVPSDDDMARTAFDTFRRYGKGQGHLAQPPDVASSRHFGWEAAPLTQPCVEHL